MRRRGVLFVLVSFVWPLFLAAQEWTLVWSDEFNGDGRPDSAVWNSKKIPYKHFSACDAEWALSFHVWRMDWDETAIRLYLDDELLNEVPLSTTVNGRIGGYTNPFHRPQYILLNLALGGDNGGIIDDAAFPMRYEIDYVRVYQLK